MVKYPQMAGWPGDLPNYEPKHEIQQVLDDFIRLHKNPTLMQSDSWMSLFASNLFSLMQVLKVNHEKPPLIDIYNWLMHAKIDQHTMHDLVYQAEKTHYKNLKEIRKFLEKWNQDEGFKDLIRLFGEYLAGE